VCTVGRQHDEYLKNYLATGEAKILGKPRMVIAERKDKSTFPIFLSVSELKVDKGKERVFIGTAKDMSSVKTSSQSNSTAGTFARSMILPLSQLRTVLLTFALSFLVV
jgi:hypothetical protein